jgi:hypothetical protein
MSILAFYFDIVRALDLVYIAARVARMEPETRTLWGNLLRKAQDDVANTR